MTRIFLAFVPLAMAGLAACNPAAPGGDPEPPLPPEEAAAEPAETAPAPLSEEEVAMLEIACDTVTVDGLCNIGFGMNDAEAKAAYADVLLGDASQNASCYYLRPDGAGYGRIFMMLDGTMQRIDIRDTSVATLEGAEVGMLLNDVEALYVGGVRTPNKYAPANEDLKVELGNGVFAVFEEGNGGKVRAYRVGLEPAVDFVEGCA